MAGEVQKVGEKCSVKKQKSVKIKALRAKRSAFLMPMNILKKTIFIGLSLSTIVILAGTFAISAFANNGHFYIDFGNTNTTDTGWNNISASEGATTATNKSLIDSTGASTAVKLKITDTFGCGANSNGTTASVVYPVNATRDSLFLGGSPCTAGFDSTAAFQINSLTDGTYTFRFFSSRTGISDDRTTQYTIGGTTVTNNAKNNVDTYTDMTGVQSSGGSVTVSLATTTGHSFGYINVLEIILDSDAQAPVISSIASSTSVSTSTVTWTTDEGTTSKVVYGTSSGNYTHSTTSSSLVTSHSIQPTSLSSGTLYYYRVVSADASNNISTSSEYTFRTNESVYGNGHYYIDFGDSTLQATTTGWNNITEVTGRASTTSLPLVDSIGTSTNVRLNVLDPFSCGATNVGTTGSTLYTAQVTRDTLFLGATACSPGANDDNRDGQAIISIGNLNSSSTYDFRFYASRLNAGLTSRITNYTIGNTTVQLDAAENVNNSISITGVSPTNNAVSITIATSSNTSLGYLGVLEITESDTTAPNISSIASTTDSNSATITWTTDESATSRVQYGPTTSYGSEVYSGTLTTSHSVQITGLSALTTYHFRVSSVDSSGNSSTSTDKGLITSTSNTSPTASAGADQSITLPTSVVTLAGSGTDADGTITAYLWEETTSLGATLLASTTASTTVTDLAPGTHTFRLTVTDNESATSSDTVTITVSSHSFDSCSAKTVVVLGSSTAAGTGASPTSNSWVNLLATYLDTLNVNHTVTNRAFSGFSTYRIMPSDYTPPVNRPSPDTARNITYAISLNPDAIIVNMPSNDASAGYTASETQTNFATVKSEADEARIPIWFSTTQPRNLSASGITLLTTVRDWITSTYVNHSIDFWSEVAASSGVIKEAYDSGDGIHLNNAGHRKLYNRVLGNSFITRLCDTTNPTVSVTSPGAVTVSGSSVSLAASASDSSEIGGVHFRVNNVEIGSEDTSAPYTATWNTTATSSGVYRITAIARDKVWNIATSTEVQVTVDNIPEISSVATSPAATSSLITWSTDIESSSLVRFGLFSGGYGTTTPEFNAVNRVTSHSVRLVGLRPCTRYHYQIQSRNAILDTATTSNDTFYTLGCTGGATVSTSTQSTVTVASGGTLTDDGLALTVPPSFTNSTSTAYFQANKLDADTFFTGAGVPTGKNRVGSSVFNLKALSDATTTISSFDTALTVSLTYEASDVDGLDEETLKIYRYDGTDWYALTGCTTNTSTRTVSCQTTGFSDFALFGDEEDEDSSGSGSGNSGSSGSGGTGFISSIYQFFVPSARPAEQVAAIEKSDETDKEPEEANNGAKEINPNESQDDQVQNETVDTSSGDAQFEIYLEESGDSYEKEIAIIATIGLITLLSFMYFTRPGKRSSN